MATVAKRRNRYVLDFYDQQGRRQRLSMPEGTTKAQAKEKLREIEEAVSKGNFLAAKKIPSFAELAQDWLKYKKSKLRETTWEVMEGHTRKHFPELNHLPVNRITVAVVEKYITERQGQGMNINTLRKILVTLGQILSYAVRHRFIDHNPLRDAERPRQQGKEEDGEDKISILTPEQINSFLGQTDNPKYYTLFLMAIMTGLRQGELLGLKWGDIDWESKQVFVQRTFNNERWFFPKTLNSKRKVDLSPAVIKALRIWRLACPSSNLELIFPNKKGSPINKNNLVKRYFLPALKKAALPQIRFHDLRHTYASLLLMFRTPDRGVSH